jgi:hypothetical protein
MRMRAASAVARLAPRCRSLPCAVTTLAQRLPLRCGSYLTDGRRLFRVVSQFDAGGKHAFASLEDCLTLEIEPYSPGELDEMNLRPVRTTE